MPGTLEADLERELERLYTLPPGEFVSARDELARLARKEGQRELAERIKGLRKPTVAAWVVNQLARERELDVQRLLKAGEALTKAQVEAAQGESGDDFAEARSEEQRALDRLHDAAREIVEREGLGQGVLERVTGSLRAGSVSDEGRQLLKRGRLAEELQPPGFEALAGLAAPSGDRRRRQVSAQRGERRKAIAEARRRVKALRADEQELGKAAAAAERQAERAEREAAVLRETAERARAEVERAAEDRAAAEQELARLES